jgi:hypothetical protein
MASRIIVEHQLKTWFFMSLMTTYNAAVTSILLVSYLAPNETLKNNFWTVISGLQEPPVFFGDNDNVSQHFFIIILIDKCWLLAFVIFYSWYRYRYGTVFLFSWCSIIYLSDKKMMEIDEHRSCKILVPVVVNFERKGWFFSFSDSSCNAMVEVESSFTQTIYEDLSFFIMF